MTSTQSSALTAFAVTLVLYGFVFLLFATPSIAADECDGCDRGAVVSKCENPDLPPNYEELYEPYWACMDRELPKDDPSVTISDEQNAFAHQRCKHLHPRIDFVTGSSIATRIAELHTTSCFHFIGSDVVDSYRDRGEREGWGDLIKPASYKIPEYAFEVVFDGVSGEASDSDGNPGSTLTIDLYYDGDERVFVKRWKTVSSTYTASSQFNRMFKNSDALMRQEVPLQNLLWEFEQTPLSCQIMGDDFFELPDGSSEVPIYSPKDIEVRPNETKEITLSGFAGRTGPSKGFNRIVVRVDEGEILNGEPLQSDPGARVFKIGDGNVTVSYRAPGSCSLKGDTIHVFNSCDIAKTSLVPLSQTRLRDEIASKPITCLTGGWTGTATLNQVHLFECNDTKQPYQTVMVLRQRDRWSDEATMSVHCEDFDFADTPIVALTGGVDIVVSGDHQRSVDESHFSEHRGSGCWSTDDITLKGSGSCAVSPDSLSLSFRKAGMADADEMRRLMQAMSETVTDDPDRYQELSAQLEALMNPESGDGRTRLKGVVQYLIDCPMDADYLKVSKGHCETDSKVTHSEEGTSLEMRGFSVSREFDAFYIKGEDGKDRIEATFNKTTPISPHAPFTGVGSHDCPPMIETFSFTLNLTRDPSN